jgi:uncharacterized protein (TIGR02599 family)
MHGQHPIQDPPRHLAARAFAAAFSLVELLVSMAVFMLILLVLLSMTSSVGKIWQSSTGKIEQFRNARNGFEAMTRRLSQATLNTYWDYDNASAPTTYLRQSELRFISGRNRPGIPATPLAGRLGSHAVFFQAPLGVTSTSAGLTELNQLLNTCGYYVEFASDKNYRPPFLQQTSVKEKFRFRLIEMIEPAEKLAIYNYTSGKGKYGYFPNAAATPRTNVNATLYVSASTPGPFPQPNGPPTPFIRGLEWLNEPLNFTKASIPIPFPFNRVLAQNIIAMVILPKLSDQDDPTQTLLAPNYAYDSSAYNANPLINPKNQLPPTVRVTLVALDESSATRIDKGSTAPGVAELGVDLTTLFTNASNYAADLNTLEKALQGKRLQYRVFTTEVAIAGAKWSR